MLKINKIMQLSFLVVSACSANDANTSSSYPEQTGLLIPFIRQNLGSEVYVGKYKSYFLGDSTFTSDFLGDGFFVYYRQSRTLFCQVRHSISGEHICTYEFGPATGLKYKNIIDEAIHNLAKSSR